MATINFRRLSVRDAEHLIAEIWNCLEEYQMPSPRLAFSFLRNGDVGLTCHFSESVWAQQVTLRLSSWLADQCSVEAARQPAWRVAPCSSLSAGRGLEPSGASYLMTTAPLPLVAVKLPNQDRDRRRGKKSTAPSPRG